MYKAKKYKNITLNNYHKMLISSTGWEWKLRGKLGGGGGESASKGCHFHGHCVKDSTQFKII